MRVLVCGGREYADKDRVFATLDALLAATQTDTLTIIQGGATGADKLARNWCSLRYVPFDNYAADWKRWGAAAGPTRNQRMLDKGKPDLVVAFPGGSGTADMVSRARAAGVDVMEVDKA
jgi:hypothetical protein